MATKYVTLSDLSKTELDDTTGHRTIVFCVDDAWYKIDLTNAEADAFAEAMSPYIESAQQYTQPLLRTKEVYDLRLDERVAIRRWYVENREKYKLPRVPITGEIPDFIVDAYDKVQGHQGRKKVATFINERTIPVTTAAERQAIRDWDSKRRKKLGLPAEPQAGRISDAVIDEYDLERSRSSGKLVERERRILGDEQIVHQRTVRGQFGRDNMNTVE